MNDRSAPIEIIGGVAATSRGHSEAALADYQRAAVLIRQIKMRKVGDDGPPGKPFPK